MSNNWAVRLRSFFTQTHRFILLSIFYTKITQDFWLFLPIAISRKCVTIDLSNEREVNKMELTITRTIHINLDEIIDNINNGFDIEDAIRDYVGGLDSCEYYLIGFEAEQEIKAEVEKVLKTRKER